MSFSKDLIKIDPRIETEKIVAKLLDDVGNKLRKRGAVVGVSGGIDSSLVLALCVTAFGNERVLAIGMPEKDSSPENFIVTQKLIDKFKPNFTIEDLTAAQYGFKTYERRDEAIKKVFPEYDLGYKVKIGIPNNLLEKKSLNVFHVTIIAPDGAEKSARLPINEYLQIVAASNFKQRSRMCMLYYHAERLNYAVIGTGNKNEHALGFFVKYGDGGADVKPIAHLFKSQVYQLAEYLEVPEEIRRRTPTTDTYSAEQTQEEFFFRMPYHTLDLIWAAWEQGCSSADIAAGLDINVDQVDFIIKDIQQKQSTTNYLRMEPL
ncbi:NAD(+) synthase [candidate division KSB1 bacterium]|nr:NAD(+) synthase [candidate division KSB1 bacterium]